MNLVAKRAILISLALLALFIAAEEQPLQGMHWDVPIYLYQAKRFAETHFLANYIRHAAAVVAQLHGNLPPDEWYSESYWRFVRVGHIAILGVIVEVFGSNQTAIAFATWLYTLFRISGIAFCFSNVLILGRKQDRKLPWFTGAALSTLLFLVSDIYRYLAGNLVSEVLSIFLLGAALLALLRAINTKYLRFAILSGLLAFVSYSARVESVWTWLTFLMAYCVTRGSDDIQSVPWKSLLAAGFTALFAYVGYATIFYPLVDPRQYLDFVSSLTAKEPGGVPGYQLLFVAGGLLWIGTLVSLGWLRQSAVVRLGWTWLVLSALPWVPQIMSGGPCQTRMLTLLVLPLVLLSSSGWALALGRGTLRPLYIAAALSLFLAIVSQPAAYTWIHSIPVAWRIQYLRPFLYVPQYERLDYLPAEMAKLSHVIFNANGPKVLISAPDLPQEYLNMIRFFGPSYSVEADLTLVGDPTNHKSCDSYSRTVDEPVLFCQGYANPAAPNVHRDSYRQLFLRQRAASAKSGTEKLLETPHFSLDASKF